jgi:hypothetical protein
MVKIDYIVGDSIATGIANAAYGKKRDGGYVPNESSDDMGISRVGAPPSQVLEFLTTIKEKLSNKNIILSTGLSNSAGDISGGLKIIEEQLKLLKDTGSRVYIAGITNNPPSTGNLPKLKDQGRQLDALANKFGFTYLEDFTPNTDLIHPKYGSYYNTNIKPKLASDNSSVTPAPVTVPVVASQVVTPSPPSSSTTPTPSAGKLYKAFVFNVEKQNILVPTANNFDLGELTIVKREYTPQAPVTDNLPDTNIGEFTNMLSADTPAKAPPGKTSPGGYLVESSSYHVANKKDKAQIMIHYSAGWQMTDKCKQVVSILMDRNHNEDVRYLRDPKNPKKLLKDEKKNPIQDPNWVGDSKGYSYHYIIAVDGHIENVVDPKDTALHGGGDSNYYSIGISLQCLGVTYHSHPKGGLLTIEQADKKLDELRLKKNSDYALNESHVELVDFNEKKRPYKNMRFSQEVSIEQLRSLSSLLKKLRQEFPNIPAWNGLTQEKFDILFPDQGTTYNKNKPGLYSHCSNSPGKFDMLPTPRMIKFLKQLRF